ncbi:3-dehydrosphinganine reductase [Nematocida minor]|uniref:3-dehydrosphinganine reductase n=1 Tax=Nematocida minor TaxID=1912983 RepID=UPI00222039F6|nr:3-dehydrosphinganine reductase [Nematocida minor]KAI5190044.1 3-dehydrosphinganine reductase [Nematocida minor]
MHYEGKKVLIVGGSSGLGLALAKDLKDKKALVTITSRSPSTLSEFVPEFSTHPVDITEQSSVDAIPSDFDLIFCCAGFATPSLAREIEVQKMEKIMNCNFFGSVRVYLHFLKHVTHEKRKSLVFISSTLGLHSFTGYGMYSPSKSALSSFYESVYDESSILGLDLYIYYVSTIQSNGFITEQKTKPEITKKIEGSSISKMSLPENRARTLLNAMPKSRIIYSDFVTRLFSKSAEINTLSDVLAYFLSPFFWICFKLFAAYTTRKHYPKDKCS